MLQEWQGAGEVTERLLVGSSFHAQSEEWKKADRRSVSVVTQESVPCWKSFVVAGLQEGKRFLKAARTWVKHPPSPPAKGVC